MSVAIRERASPNHGERKAAIDMLHYTGMKTAAESLERLCDPAAEVSAHYLVEEDGTVWRLVASPKTQRLPPDPPGDGRVLHLSSAQTYL